MLTHLWHTLLEAAFISSPFIVILAHQVMTDIQDRRRRAEFLRGNLVNKDLLR
jgi:hypothetical protein